MSKKKIARLALEYDIIVKNLKWEGGKQKLALSPWQR